MHIGILKSKFSASSVVVLSILAIQLVIGAQFLNGTFAVGAPVTVISPFTKM